MQGEKLEQMRRWLVRAAIWLGAGLLVVAALRSISVTSVDRADPADQVANRSAERTIRVKTVDRHPMDPNWQKIERGDFDLIAGETMSIAAQDLPTERPLVLNLLLSAGLSRATALPVRIIAMDDSGELKPPGAGELKLPDAVVTTARDRVRVQIESDWLSPGLYRIEIETTERSDLTPRHYLLEVR